MESAALYTDDDGRLVNFISGRKRQLNAAAAQQPCWLPINIVAVATASRWAGNQ